MNIYEIHYLLLDYYIVQCILILLLSAFDVCVVSFYLHRHCALETDAYTSNCQPVNSDVRPFREMIMCLFTLFIFWACWPKSIHTNLQKTKNQIRGASRLGPEQHFRLSFTLNFYMTMSANKTQTMQCVICLETNFQQAT